MTLSKKQIAELDDKSLSSLINKLDKERKIREDRICKDLFYIHKKEINQIKEDLIELEISCKEGCFVDSIKINNISSVGFCKSGRGIVIDSEPFSFANVRVDFYNEVTKELEKNTKLRKMKKILNKKYSDILERTKKLECIFKKNGLNAIHIYDEVDPSCIWF